MVGVLHDYRGVTLLYGCYMMIGVLHDDMGVT